MGATIVFCDVVGFSQNNNDRQADIITCLNAEVTHELYRYVSAINLIVPEIISLPTGDGMAIALTDRDKDKPSWTPVLFSLIYRLMKWSNKESNLRIGVHVGPVSIIADINRRPNVCGTTVNECQRIMDAAHPNQVLFSEAAYNHCIGSSNYYSGSPFSAQAPALFKGPYSIIAKHGLRLGTYIMYQEYQRKGREGRGEGRLDWVVREPFPRGDIRGGSPRTEFIVSYLEELVRKQKPLSIFEQAVFGTFGIVDDEQLRKEYGEEYLNLRLQQRELLDKLAQQERTELKLIIAPRGKPSMFSVEETCIRLRALLKWMESRWGNPNIDWVRAPFHGPNRLIVADEFCIEGYRYHYSARYGNSAGYEMSMAYYDRDKIDTAVKEFLAVFEEAKRGGQTKETVINDIKQEIDQLCPEL
jgi:hypothetical protein